MQIYRLASVDDLAVASGRKFRSDLEAALVLFFKLAERYFDGPTRNCLNSLAALASDSTACRDWCETIHEIRDFCSGVDAVPNSSFTSHLDIDRGDAGRVAELLLWQLCGAITTPGARVPAPPLACPARLAIGGLGVLRLERIAPDARCAQLDWTDNRPLLRTKSGELVLDAGDWEPYIRLAGSGLRAAIPLEDRALASPRLQDFPIVGARDYASKWGSAVIRGACDIADYSAVASAVVERFITHVLPLLCSDQAIGSASRQEALGLVFLPAILDRQDLMTECLLHEAMHQYLFRLESCARLFDPVSPSEAEFFSPWRRDKRPLRMTLHGSFVFAAVADLYLWVAESPRWDLVSAVAQRRAYQRYRESSIALEVVRKYGVMSTIGRRVVDALGADLANIRARLAPQPKDVAEVDRTIDEHLCAHANHLH